MKKFFQFTKAIFILTVLISVLAITSENAFAENETFKIAPPSQKFLEWQQKQNSNTQNIYRDKSSSMEDLPRVSGYIPLAVDLSHLSKNPPIEISKRDKATTIPSAYDLRTAGNFLTSVKDQDPYGTCWAFAAIGSMESNYMKQGNPEMNLSVMHLAWFAYKNTDSSKTYTDDGSESDEVFTGDRVLNLGGNEVFSVATYSRLDGPVLELDVPYGKKPAYSVPEAYNRVLRLRDAYFFDATSRAFDSMSNIKERIIQHGAVQASYCGDAYDAYAVINGYSTFYKKTNSINHAILLVGWDDNFSKENFKYKPSSDGAWLVKNSWGDRWNNSSYQKVGDNGYFWISYEQTLSEGVSFIVEAVNSDLKCYYYDALGWIGNLYGSSYAANIFQASRTNEKLKEISFYTPDNNQTCEIKIYTGINSLSSNPNSGTLALTQSEYIASAGYHTVTLNSPVELTNGEFFSVIVKYPTSVIPIEYKVSYYSDNAKIDSGSYFSSSGSSWQKGTSSSIKANACIKAFTVTGDSSDEPDEPIITGEAPTITTTSITSTGKTDAIYSQTFKATGDYPIYWTYSGTIPTGLTFSNSGVLAGMPTKTGTFNFTVIATNAYGSDSREFTVRISSGASSAVAPSISEATLDNGYVSESYSQTIEISGTTPFSIAKKSGFPSGLTPRISGSNLIIAGTPKKEGNFSLSVTVKNSAGSDTQDFSLTILEKPTITTKSLKNAKTDSKYSASLAAKGSNITWEVTGLPETLTLTQNSNGTKATIEGTPTEAGTYNPTFTVTNSAGTSSKTLKLIVNGVAPKLTVKFAKGTADSDYTGSTIYATGTKPITFTCSIKPTTDLKKLGISSLSDLGLTFTANSEEGTATITGTPTISFKNLPITITAKNSVSTKSKTAKLTVSGQKPVFTSPSETEYLYKTGENVNIDFEVEGTDFITFSSSGQGTLSLTKTGTKTARLSGRAPTSEKKLTIKVKASNSDGNTTQKIILQTKTLPTITTEKLSNATSGKSYKTKLTASGSKKITWEISGELPDGINFDENTGSLTGTPKEDGIFDLTFTAVNSIGESTKTLTLNVGDSKETANSLPDLVSESELNSENYSDYSDQESTNISGISITNERNISSLSNEFIQKISDEGLVIAAVLPEFSIEEDNIYEFTVSIDENIPVNSKLIWRSQSELNTTDNSELIAFYESEDLARENAIEFVPENREIIIEVWLKLGKYSPIILAAPNDN